MYGWFVLNRSATNRNTPKALGRLRSRGSLRSSLRCGAYVVVLPGPGLALSVRQDTGFPAGSPWWTERASGGRRCPDDASTAANVVSEAHSESRRPSAVRAFEVVEDSFHLRTLDRSTSYTPCTDQFSIAEHRICEPLYEIGRAHV